MVAPLHIAVHGFSAFRTWRFVFEFYILRIGYELPITKKAKKSLLSAGHTTVSVNRVRLAFRALDFHEPNPFHY
jgi:hypothetical protein